MFSAVATLSFVSLISEVVIIGMMEDIWRPICNWGNEYLKKTNQSVLSGFWDITPCHPNQVLNAINLVECFDDSVCLDWFAKWQSHDHLSLSSSKKPRVVVLFNFCAANVFQSDRMVMQTYIQEDRPRLLFWWCWCMVIAEVIFVNAVTAGGSVKFLPVV